MSSLEAKLDPDLRHILQQVKYPGFDDLNLVDIGLIREAAREGERIRVSLRPLAAPETTKENLRRRIEDAFQPLPVVISEENARDHSGPQPLPGVKAVLAVASGKGGVGKSTVAVNLALGLRQAGLAVGLLDLDLQGPSLPLMLGLEGRQVLSRDGLILPLEHYGLKVLSGGFMSPAGKALMWRGPMLIKAVRQLLRQADWAPLDVLVLDLPPGTGDVHMAVLREVTVNGVLMVSTAHSVALIDVVKALDLFRRNQVAVLGLVENMSYFRCPDCGARHEIFGHGSVASLAGDLGIDYLGDLPLDPEARLGADHKFSAPDSPLAGSVWRELARQARERLNGLIEAEGVTSSA